jgi:phosphocarrier protein
MHARAASLFVQTANQFDSDITIAKGTQEVNAKSIMGILILAAACGTEVVISAKGSDSTEALDAIEDLIERKFDEE